MLKPNPTAVLALRTRVDVLARTGGGPLMRTASYEGGEHWQQPWTLLFEPSREGVQPGNPIPPPPQDYGLAAAASGDGRILHVCARATQYPGDGERGFFWHRRTDDFTRQWTPWHAIGIGSFISSPAMAVSGDGQRVVVVGRGKDDRMWFARSHDAGTTWDVAWQAIGQGTFLHYNPAIAASADAQRLVAFGHGHDAHIWHAFSSDGGNHWEMAWAPIGVGTFNSGPGAAASADGRRVVVAARGLDNRMYVNVSTDGAGHWAEHWTVMPEGTGFQSAPAVAASWDGMTVHVFALGGDGRVWRAASFDGAATWALAWAPVGTHAF